MKHIKAYGKFTDVHYKIFESTETNIKEDIKDIKLDINDILIGMKDDDDDIRFVVQELPHPINRLSINIYYAEDPYDVNGKDKILDTNKYADELLRLNDYLEMNGYTFSTYNYPGVSYDEVTNDFNKIFDIKPINGLDLIYK
jgi:hypothetical protein